MKPKVSKKKFSHTKTNSVLSPLMTITSVGASRKNPHHTESRLQTSPNESSFKKGSGLKAMNPKSDHSSSDSHHDLSANPLIIISPLDKSQLVLPADKSQINSLAEKSHMFSIADINLSKIEKTSMILSLPGESAQKNEKIIKKTSNSQSLPKYNLKSQSKIMIKQTSKGNEPHEKSESSNMSILDEGKDILNVKNDKNEKKSSLDIRFSLISNSNFISRSKSSNVNQENDQSKDLMSKQLSVSPQRLYKENSVNESGVSEKIMSPEKILKNSHNLFNFGGGKKSNKTKQVHKDEKNKEISMVGLKNLNDDIQNTQVIEKLL